VVTEDPSARSAGAAHPPLTRNTNSYLGPIAEGAALREVRYLDDGRRITFYSYRAGTHALPGPAPVVDRQ
jgi:hypothetical protein